MAIARLKKVAIVGHKANESELLARLQSAGILHITRRGEVSEYKSDPKLKEHRDAVGSAIEYISNFGAKKGLIENLITTLRPVEPEEYDRTVREFDLEGIKSQVDRLERRLTELDAQRKGILAELELLAPWVELPYRLDEVYGLGSVQPEFGVLPDPKRLEELNSKLDALPAHIDLISQLEGHPHCLLLIPKDLVIEVKSTLSSSHWEPVDLSKFKEQPKKIVKRFQAELVRIDEERKKVVARSKGLVAQLPALKLLYDHYQGLLDREAAQANFLYTEHAFLIEGWVRAQDYNRLSKLIAQTPHTAISELKPEPDERPPVKLENRRFFKPFELVLDLFSMPQPWEIDPTPLVAPFFALFFGLCLTDAGYGIVLIILALILRRRIRGRLLDIMVIAGGFAVLTGALTGGWFGDLPARLGLGFLKDLRASLLIFDPLEDPMPFFYLSLALGFIQLNFGILVEVYDSLRRRRYASGILEHLSWFVILHSILGLIGTQIGLLPENLSEIFLGLAVGSFLAGLFYVSLLQAAGSLLDRLLRGFFRIYDLISFLGNNLSYMRLMALGMVTGGIGMAINILAGMVINIPIAGIILGLLILILGHAFNLAISCLGGFVHTLRLQYVEFFPRFFTGGGQKFMPFRLQTRYIELIREGG
jgi:V/A-type H+-transporting ATPase subunit I